jgi:hypothetical protein
MLFKLTLSNVKENAKKAYYARRLIPQQSIVTKCLYRNDEGAVCAIGASLPRDFPLTREENSLPLSMGLIQTKFLINARELEPMIAIQTAHDRWAAAARCYSKASLSTSRTLRDLEAKFLSLIS